MTGLAPVAIGALLGLLCLYQCAHVPALSIQIVLFIASLTLFLLSGWIVTDQSHRLYRWLYRAGAKRWLCGMLGLASFCIAMAWGAFYSAHQLEKRRQLTPDFNHIISITGRVVRLPSRHLYQQQFGFQVKRKGQTYLLQLSWYAHKPIPLPQLHLGDIWHLNVRLRAPRALINPGGRDREAYWLAKGVSALGSVVKREDNRCLGNQATLMQRLRDRLFYHFQTTLSPPFKSLILALSLGFGGALREEQVVVLRNTGTLHLIAISGLHLGLVARFFYQGANGLWRIIPRLMLYLPAQQVAPAFAALGCLFYAALAGFSLPTQRALCMLWVLFGAQWMRRRLFHLHHLWVALLVLLAINPLSALMPGFWLSFAAVWILLQGTQLTKKTGLLRGWRAWIRTFFSMQWQINVMMLPLSLWFFHQFSYIGLLVNGFAIPWVSYAVMPCLLVGCLCLLCHACFWGDQLIAWSIGGIHLLWQGLGWFSALPFTHWDHDVSVGILCGMVVTWCWARYLSSSKWATYGLVGSWLLLLGLPVGKRLEKGSVRLTVLDVGQGLATVLQTRNHRLVFDAGPHSISGFDSGARIVLPYLHHQSRDRLDRLVISHPDNDHAGGALALEQAFPQLYLLDSLPRARHFPKNQHQLCHAGMQWTWDGVHFEFLTVPHAVFRSTNNRACVMRVTAGKHSILLPADIEARAERYVLAHHRDQLPASILIAPHHGSRSSSSWPFIWAVNPAYVIFSRGLHNRYHFPHPTVVKRYRLMGAKALDTAICGPIEMLLQPHHAIEVVCYREAHHRFWYTQGFRTE